MNGTIYKRAVGAALDLLFPRRCPVCGRIAGLEGICPECRKKVPYVRQPFCLCCGRPVDREETEYCAACAAHPPAYTRGRALCLYADPVKKALQDIKYNNKREYLDFFAGEMVERLGPAIHRWDPQALIPIPMYPSDRRKRGYNQAELLAKRLGERLLLPVDTKTLKKKRKTIHQKELDYRGRRSNLKNAFAVENTLQWERILLVDDVCTTGSTLNEAARVLLAAGAREVCFVTVCIVP